MIYFGLAREFAIRGGDLKLAWRISRRPAMISDCAGWVGTLGSGTQSGRGTENKQKNTSSLLVGGLNWWFGI